jgi:hypothetical protein
MNKLFQIDEFIINILFGQKKALEVEESRAFFKK